MPFIRIIPILTLIFFLTGCAEEEEENSRYGGTLILSVLTELEGLNPILYRNTFSKNIEDMIFNSLVRFNEKLEPSPDLAESWQVSEDGLVWSFKLRRGSGFTTGSSSPPKMFFLPSNPSLIRKPAPPLPLYTGW